MQQISNLGDEYIKIYVVSHDDRKVSSTSCLYPIRSDMIYGDNIACENNYCELRTQYLVWKNQEFAAKYVGFFHFRRFLQINERALLSNTKRKNKVPYSIEKFPNYQDYTLDKLSSALNGIDIISPIWEYTGLPVWTRYANAKGHQLSDLKLIYEIILHDYPEYQNAAEQYLTGCGEYYGNMYIMRYELFQKYCEWLFGILRKFDQITPTRLPNTDGYLGERLFGIYYTWLKDNTDIEYLEVPRILYYGFDDANHHFFRERIINYLLPPGKKMRAAMRKIFYCIDHRSVEFE